MNRPFLFWQIWRAGHSKPPAIARIQQRRLGALLAFARARSPFYAHHYRQLAPAHTALEALPPVTKPMLMADFDGWVTDPAVTRAGIESFVADPALVGHLYLDRYAVYTTSGTSGTPGLFLHDRHTLAVYDLLWPLRGWLPWLGVRRLLAPLRPDFHEVFVVATGAHFGGAATAARLRHRYPWMAGRLPTLSVLQPLPELVRQLNRLQPDALTLYPTLLSLLLQEQRSGRLSIHPLLIVTSGEWLAPVVREEATTVFNCPVRDVYACSEFFYAAFTCAQGWLHANADWLILEPVDANYRPVPPGQPSATVLLTNLANRIQPLIRYDLGDSLTLRPEPCPCGNPLPALRVEGRQDEILTFATAAGSTVRVLPIALATAVETTDGVRRYQLIQTGPAALTIRLETVPGVERSQTWERVEARLREYLASQGLAGVIIEEAAEPPRRDLVSGKFRHVWSEVSVEEGSYAP